MMKIEAHKNTNKDLLVTFSFEGEETEDLCVGTDARWMDDKDKGNFMADWKGRIASQFSSHAGRPLTDGESAGLAEAIDKAKVQ